MCSRPHDVGSIHPHKSLHLSPLPFIKFIAIEGQHSTRRVVLHWYKSLHIQTHLCKNKQVPVAPQSIERGGRVAPQHHRTTNKASHGAGGVGSSGEGTLDMLVEVLLRTNPALR